MRLNVNGKELSLSDKSGFASVVRDAVDLLFQEYGNDNKIVLEWTKQNLSWASNERGIRIPQKPTQKRMSLTKGYISDKTMDLGEQNISLFQTKKIHPADPSLSILMPRRYSFKGRLTLGAKDKELIFYLVFVSALCAPLHEKSLSAYQNKLKATPWFEVKNENKDAKRSIDSIQQKARVQFAIATQQDEYKLSDSELVALGFTFGMKNPQSSGPDLIRQYLLNLLDRPGSETNLQKIDELVRSERKLASNSLFYKAKSNNYIGLRSAGSKKHWCWKDDSGNFTDEIMKCSSGVKEDVQLISMLINDNPTYEKFKFEMEARNETTDIKKD